MGLNLSPFLQELNHLQIGANGAIIPCSMGGQPVQLTVPLNANVAQAAATVQAGLGVLVQNDHITPASAIETLLLVVLPSVLKKPVVGVQSTPVAPAASAPEKSAPKSAPVPAHEPAPPLQENAPAVEETVSDPGGFDSPLR